MTSKPETCPPGPPFGHRTVTAESVSRFAELTGDYARIHVDHTFGAATPSGRGFAHGLLSASWALGALALHAPDTLALGARDRLLTAFSTRFHEPVGFGDTLALQRQEMQPAPSGRGAREEAREALAGTRFTWTEPGGRVVTSGTVQVGALPTEAGAPWPDIEPGGPSSAEPVPAEALMATGPRGARRVATITETDVVNWCRHTGALDPLALDTAFAARTQFGERVVPPHALLLPGLFGLAARTASLADGGWRGHRGAPR